MPPSWWRSVSNAGEKYVGNWRWRKMSPESCSTTEERMEEKVSTTVRGAPMKQIATFDSPIPRKSSVEFLYSGNSEEKLAVLWSVHGSHFHLPKGFKGGFLETTHFWPCWRHSKSARRCWKYHVYKKCEASWRCQTLLRCPWICFLVGWLVKEDLKSQTRCGEKNVKNTGQIFSIIQTQTAHEPLSFCLLYLYHSGQMFLPLLEIHAKKSATLRDCLLSLFFSHWAPVNPAKDPSPTIFWSLFQSRP